MGFAKQETHVKGTCSCAIYLCAIMLVDWPWGRGPIWWQRREECRASLSNWGRCFRSQPRRKTEQWAVTERCNWTDPSLAAPALPLCQPGRSDHQWSQCAECDLTRSETRTITHHLAPQLYGTAFDSCEVMQDLFWPVDLWRWGHEYDPF